MHGPYLFYISNLIINLMKIAVIFLNSYLKHYLGNGIGDNYCFKAGIVDPEMNQSSNLLIWLLSNHLFEIIMILNQNHVNQPL